ncbi:MAG: 5-(carboxyamino)imidazole ribonucleotide mutase [Kiritimatiellae bacterium]|nr:5-(carboxyamino)imidazole ribonucleotide mutase [Kiritimatiellia bacterium]
MPENNTREDVVGVVMGSDSDWPLMEGVVRTLRDFGVAAETRIISAHRAPASAAQYAKSAERRGLKIIIAAAGGAAHLAGTFAAHSILPVIGIPVKGGAFAGMDALLSTVQMPSGVPVATVAVGPSGPVNAALLAIQILALQNRALARKLHQYKRDLSKKVMKSNRKIQSSLPENMRRKGAKRKKQ